MMSLRAVLYSSVLVLIAMAAPSHATTVSFDSNAAGAADATIIQGGPNNNYDSSVPASGNHVFYAGLEVTSNADRSRSFEKFDVSSLAGVYSSIDAITLRVTTSYNTAASGVVDIHQALASWVESEVTWNMRDNINSWTTAGGDFAATVLGSIDFSTLSTGGSADSVQQQVTISLLPGAGNAAARKALIDSWAGGSNFGLLLKAASEPGASYKGLRDRSRADAGDRPLLTVEFTPVPEPSSLSLGACAIAIVSYTFRRRRQIEHS